MTIVFDDIGVLHKFSVLFGSGAVSSSVLVTQLNLYPDLFPKPPPCNLSSISMLRPGNETTKFNIGGKFEG